MTPPNYALDGEGLFVSAHPSVQLFLEAVEHVANDDLPPFYSMVSVQTGYDGVDELVHDVLCFYARLGIDVTNGPQTRL